MQIKSNKTNKNILTLWTNASLSVIAAVNSQLSYTKRDTANNSKSYPSRCVCNCRQNCHWQMFEILYFQAKHLPNCTTMHLENFIVVTAGISTNLCNILLFCRCSFGNHFITTFSCAFVTLETRRNLGLAVSGSRWWDRYSVNMASHLRFVSSNTRTS